MEVDLLKVALADVVVFAQKIQFYHWNVEGHNFSEHHSFFGTIYEEIAESIDPLAEIIRTTNAYAPGTLQRFKELTTIEETDTIPEAGIMFINLYRDNALVLASLLKAYDAAEKSNEFGISNFLQDRIQAHEKHHWMLRSYTK